MGGRKIDYPDVLFGGFLIFVAAGALAATRNLNVGSAASMGPGYFPVAISLGVMGFGLVFTARGLFKPHEGIERVQFRPLFFIIASVAVFSLLAAHFGLVVASLACVIVAGFAGREHRLIEGIAFAVVLTAFAILLFVRLLGLPIQVWPW